MFIRFQTSKERLAVPLSMFLSVLKVPEASESLCTALSWLAMSSTGMSDMCLVSLRLNWLLPEPEKPPLIWRSLLVNEKFRLAGISSMSVTELLLAMGVDWCLGMLLSGLVKLKPMPPASY